MKLGKGIVVVPVLAVILCSVASAGNVNPVTVTMEGALAVGHGIGETGPIVEGAINNASAGDTSSPYNSDMIDWWPMFRHDPAHTGYSTSTAPETCNVLWNYTTGGYVESSPAVVDGRVYIGSWDGKVYCLDAETGELIWNYKTGDLIWSSPTIANI